MFMIILSKVPILPSSLPLSFFSFWLFETESHTVVQDSLKLMAILLLPLPFMYWDYRYVLPGLNFLFPL